jgi:hypothetical protein
MIKLYPSEQWKEIVLPKKRRFRYAISSNGRMISFSKTFEDGTLLKNDVTKGYKVFRFHYIENGAKVLCHFYVHKLVAEYFLKQEAEDKPYVIHIDHNKENNSVANLKWVSHEEMLAHNRNNPRVVENTRRLVAQNLKRPGVKLDETKVKRIKRMIFNPNRKTRLKMIARQFGISEMQLYRIKSGENWGHVTIE